MTPIGIVGAGITGLTAAFYLHREGIPVTVYESSPRAGGMIQTIRRDGFIAERGPNTIISTAPQIPALINDLGLLSRCLYPAPEMNGQYLVRDGRPVRLPKSVMDGARTSLLSLRAKLRVLGEPFVPRRIGEDESLSAFVTRRLGGEVLEYFVDPFVGGIYAGNPDRLSVTYALPKLWALEQRYGSLVKGTILGACQRKKRATVSKASAPKLTFDDGLDVLVEALRSSLGAAVHLESAVSGLMRDEQRWVIETQAGGKQQHSAVLLCAPAYSVAGIRMNGGGQRDLGTLREIHYPPIARVAAGFRREQVTHPLDGFGVLISRKEEMNTLGILFASSLFPNRAPEGHVMLTAYLGGARGAVGGNDAHLVDLAVADMRKLLGVSGSPVFEDVARIPRSIPQYNVGYGAVKDAIRRFEAHQPGVFIAANYRDGISVADCIVNGKAASERVKEYIGHA